MKTFIKQRLNSIKEGIYGDGLFEAPIIVDREKYQGRGRPRKTDYISVIQAQRKINQYRNLMINKMFVPKR